MAAGEDVYEAEDHLENYLGNKDSLWKGRNLSLHIKQSDRS